ncbi:Protein phosphatase 2C-like protein [Neofusicoccum parvum]|nr:Protein phosphatase 2C-like protein [Neofusicoccum parvum]
MPTWSWRLPYRAAHQTHQLLRRRPSPAKHSATSPPTLVIRLHPAAAAAAAAAAAWQQPRAYAHSAAAREPKTGSGTTTPVPDEAAAVRARSKSPFYFEAGYALYAKRPSRPFPPPFLSYPSGSFSDPLSTHNRSRDRRSFVNGEMIRGITNGDDAVLVTDNFIGANDGVGAWAARERGHAALWSRLILHFWALEAEKDGYGFGRGEPNPVEYLHSAFEQTKQATSDPNEWHGTTTACSALLGADPGDPPHPILYVTQLGDSQVLVLRPRDREVVYKTAEQWHWFDCPRQLGTNSPDTPRENAVLDRVQIEEDDVVLAMSDGVVDNLWEHEVLENVVDSMHKWENGEADFSDGEKKDEKSYADGMQYVAQELVKAARTIAEDPFAESPYMEKAVDEGLSIEGGKLDDISVVAAICKRRKS